MELFGVLVFLAALIFFVSGIVMHLSAIKNNKKADDYFKAAAYMMDKDVAELRKESEQMLL